VNLDPGAKKTTRFLLPVAHAKKISRTDAKAQRFGGGELRNSW